MEEMGALTRVVFQAFGFGGDRSDYYDPANSHLHRVLERRKGIPISLALVLLGVARRVGVPLHGINFPCHFLVGHRDRADYFIDPFNEGTILGIPQCEALLKRVAGGRVSFHADLLKPVSNRRILLRMLGNLKGIYLRSQDLPQAVAVTERILLMEPTNWGEVRDRGLLYLKMGAYQRAVEDLDTYLSKADHVPDRAIIGRHLEQARVQAERLT
jgi:regulator of sirC expression with transglutaminase-like and TPR domain